MLALDRDLEPYSARSESEMPYHCCLGFAHHLVSHTEALKMTTLIESDIYEIDESEYVRKAEESVLTTSRVSGGTEV